MAGIFEVLDSVEIVKNYRCTTFPYPKGDIITFGVSDLGSPIWGSCAHELPARQFAIYIIAVLANELTCECLKNKAQGQSVTDCPG